MSTNRLLHQERQARELARGPRGPSNIKRFRDLHPPLFMGTETVLEADEWFQRMEDTLRDAAVEDERKMEIVSLQLTDLARTWWKAEARRIGGEFIPWDHLQRALSCYVFPCRC